LDDAMISGYWIQNTNFITDFYKKIRKIHILRIFNISDRTSIDFLFIFASRKKLLPKLFMSCIEL